MTKTKKNIPENIPEQAQPVEELGHGEAKYVAKVKLTFNRGRLRLVPGDTVILGPEDREAGINLDKLLENGGIEPYRDEAQVQAIRKWWEEEGRPARETLRAGMSRGRR